MEEVVNESDYDRIDELVTQDRIDHAPFGEARGRNALRETTTRLRTAFPDFSVTPHEVVADGDTVVSLRERTVE